jgi:hypothetical protein
LTARSHFAGTAKKDTLKIGFHIPFEEY